MRHRATIAALAVLCLLALTACGNDSSGGAAGGKLSVVASIFPIYDLTRSVAGDAADVQLLLPPGRNGHSFNPTPSDVKKVSVAKVAFIVGLDLDEWAAKTVEAAGAGAKIVRLGKAVTGAKGFYTPKLGDAPETAEAGDDHDDDHGDDHGDDHDDDHAGSGSAAPGSPPPAEEHGDEHDHDHGSGPDPHVWMSVAKALQMVDVITAELSAAAPASKATFEANAATLKAALTKLHEEIKTRTAAFTKKGFVTFHGSFGYFADEYDLEIVAVIEPSPGKEPSASYLKDVLEGLKDKPVGALYTEPQLDPRPAEVLAKEAALPLYILDPVGGLEGRDSYEALMRFNLAALEKSMK